MNLQIIDILDTLENKGLVSICFNANVIAYPDTIQGYVNVKFYDNGIKNPNKDKLVKAFSSPIMSLSLSTNGEFLVISAENVI